MRLLVVFFFVSIVFPNHAFAQEAPNPALYVPLFSYPPIDGADGSTGVSDHFSPNDTRPGDAAEKARPRTDEGGVGTFRSNLCDASYRALISREIPLERALEGVSITVAIDSSNFLGQFDRDADGNPLRLNATYPGLIPSLLDALCDRAGCSWRDFYSLFSVDDVQQHPNTTFSELLKWTTEVYDVSASIWSRSIERLRDGTTFLEQWYDGSIIMIARQRSGEFDSFDPWAWLAPFDYNVWLMIVVTIAFSTVVHWLIEIVFNAERDSSAPPHESQHQFHDRDYWNLLQPWETIWRVATTFAGQFEFDPKSGPSYLFSFSIAFWALIMGASYTANLASFLVIRNQQSLSIVDMQHAVSLNLRMCVRRSALQDLVVSTAFPVYAQQSGNLVRMDSDVGVFQGLHDGTCDIAIAELGSWQIFKHDRTINPNCNLEWIGRAFQTIPVSFGLRSDAGSLCTSLLRDVFNVHMIDMQASGVLQKLWDQQIDQIRTIDCLGSSNNNPVGMGGGQQSRRQLGQEISLPLYVKDIIPKETSSYHIRHLQAQGVGDEVTTTNDEGVSNGSRENGGDSNRLSLTNMGGVFLLHGMLSMVAVLCAAVSWARKRGFWVTGIFKDKSAMNCNKTKTHCHEEENDNVAMDEIRVEQQLRLEFATHPRQTQDCHDRHQIEQDRMCEMLKHMKNQQSSVESLFVLQTKMKEQLNVVEARITAQLSEMNVKLSAFVDEHEHGLLESILPVQNDE